MPIAKLKYLVANGDRKFRVLLKPWVQQPQLEPDPDHLVENYKILRFTCLHTNLRVTGTTLRHRVNFNFSGAFAIMRKRLLASACLSVRPHGSLLPQDGCSLNLIREDVSKMCWDNSSFINLLVTWCTKFNIKQLYILPTLYLSQNKQRLVPLTA
jgi:hypothetical protein